MERVRAGDESAAAELGSQFEPQIRREVRLRMRDSRLRRSFDSVDVCQSVLASFFAGVTHDQYELERPEHLLRLLMTMARNKLVRRVRHQRARRRDDRRIVPCSEQELGLLASEDNSPSRVVSNRELLGAFRTLLSQQEWELAEKRSEGQGWAEIAANLGGSPEGRRKQLARALDRATHQMRLDDSCHA